MPERFTVWLSIAPKTSKSFVCSRSPDGGSLHSGVCLLWKSPLEGIQKSLPQLLPSHSDALAAGSYGGLEEQVEDVHPI